MLECTFLKLPSFGRINLLTIFIGWASMASLTPGHFDRRSVWFLVRCNFRDDQVYKLADYEANRPNDNVSWTRWRQLVRLHVNSVAYLQSYRPCECIFPTGRSLTITNVFHKAGKEIRNVEITLLQSFFLSALTNQTRQTYSFLCGFASLLHESCIAPRVWSSPAYLHLWRKVTNKILLQTAKGLQLYSTKNEFTSKQTTEHEIMPCLWLGNYIPYRQALTPNIEWCGLCFPGELHSFEWQSVTQQLTWPI